MIHGAKSGVQVRRFRWLSTLAYKTLDGNGSFEKRGNNRRNKILDSILLAAGFISKKFSLVGFSLYSKVLLRWMEMIDRVTAYSPPFIARSSIRISSYPWLESLAYREPTIVSKYIGASLRTSNFFAGGKGRSN